MDIFTWSIPFVSEKVTEVLFNILSTEGEEESDDEDVTSEDIEKFKHLKQNNNK